jgi:hypothetical protein
MSASLTHSDMVAGISRRHVRRYFCEHCQRGRSSLSAIRNHVARCFKNPAVQACKTCAFFQSSEGPSFDMVYPGCPEGCGEGIDISGGIKTACPKWEAVW